jgi:predicted P-loop ATPase
MSAAAGPPGTGWRQTLPGERAEITAADGFGYVRDYTAEIEKVASLRSRLADSGYRPVAVYTVEAGKRLGHDKPGKHPFGDKWQTRARQTPPADAEEPPQEQALNTGLLCDGLRVIDIDVDDPAIVHEIIAIVHAVLGDAPVRYRSNSPRRAFLFRAAEGQPRKRSVVGTRGKVEVLGHGQQFVAFGGHESGVIFEWHPESPDLILPESIPAITEQQVSDLLNQCAELIGAAPPRQANGEHRPGENAEADDFLELVAALRDIPNFDGPADWEAWNRVGMAVWRATKGDEFGFRAFDRWSARHPSYDSKKTAERWQNYSRSPPTQIGAPTVFFLASEARARAKAEQRRRQQEEAPDFDPDEPPEIPERAARQNTLALVAHISDREEWRDALTLNLLTETTEIAMHLRSLDRCDRRPLVDADVLESVLYFQAHGFPKASKGSVLDTLTVVAHRNAYHPVQMYLNGLEWDGTERVSRLFLDYFGAAPKLSNNPSDEEQRAWDAQTSYLEHVATCFMVGAVARVMEPGCKVDHVPVLVGPQGSGKSTALRALCRDADWFSDDLSPNLIDRDTKESLRGKWLVELAEIPHVRREAERVKAFFTRPTDRYRAAYGLLNRDHPRQCFFAGSSNDVEFVDPTGNRRFWPIPVAGQIDIARIKADRDQLWAEAASLYQKGVSWWLPPKIEEIAAEVQASFAETDIWQDAIARWAGGRASSFTMEELFAGFLPFKEATAATKADQGRAAACLKRLGYARRQQMLGGLRAYRWSKT